MVYNSSMKNNGVTYNQNDNYGLIVRDALVTKTPRFVTDGHSGYPALILPVESVQDWNGLIE